MDSWDSNQHSLRGSLGWLILNQGDRKLQDHRGAYVFRLQQGHQAGSLGGGPWGREALLETLSISRLAAGPEGSLGEGADALESLALQTLWWGLARPAQGARVLRLPQQSLSRPVWGACNVLGSVR